MNNLNTGLGLSFDPSNGWGDFLEGLANHPSSEILIAAERLEKSLLRDLEGIYRLDLGLGRMISQIDKTLEVQKQCSDDAQTAVMRTVGKIDALLTRVTSVEGDRLTGAFLKEVDSIVKLAIPYVSHDAESLRTTDYALGLLSSEIKEFSKHLKSIESTINPEQLALAEAALELARKKLEDLLQETAERDFDIVHREEFRTDVEEEGKMGSLASAFSNPQH